MSRVVVHIGTHKTGTSALQNLLFINRDILEKQDFIYPQAGWGGAHHGLAGNWVDVASEYRVSGGLQPWRQGFAQMAAQNKTLVLSSEEFSRSAPRRVNMAELRDLLAPFDQIELVCSLRSQARYIQSIYLESLKHGTPMEVGAFIDEAIDSACCDGLFLDFNELHEHLRTGFAEDEIHYLSFEQCQRAGGSPKCITERVKPGLYDQLRTTGDQGMDNVSPPPLPAWLASRAGTSEADVIARFARQLAQEHGERPTSLFTADQLERCSERFEPANRRFEALVATAQSGLAIAPVDLPENVLLRDAIAP